MITTRLKASLALALAVLLAAAGAALAVPRTITYQGVLSDDGGPVTGSLSVTFRIYGASTGGTPLWEEEQTVDFENGAFAATLGSVTPIPTSVFGGARRWLSVTIEGESEMLPRPEIVSVGYAFNAATADDAVKLDGRESSEYAGAIHTHDSRYYTQAQLSTTDGDPPNEGLNLVHWDILKGVPTGFADGVDDTGGGVTDHGLLTGLSDDDHPQYARKTVLQTSDGTPPNEGSNQVDWNNLTGVPAGLADGIDNTTEGGTIDHGDLAGLEDDDHPQYALEANLQTSDGTPPNTGSNQVNWNNLSGVPSGFADGSDAVTTDATLITTGTMSPERIAGTAVTMTYGGLLTESEKDSLTSGGITNLHYHHEIGDISSVSPGAGLTGGGIEGAVTISHAADASALRNAHHPAPIVMHHQGEDYVGGAGVNDMDIITWLEIDVPDSGYLEISFSGMQVMSLYDAGVTWEAARYIAEYGVAVDNYSTFDYYVRSSMYDTDPDAIARVFDEYLPQTSVSGTTVKRVDAGVHSVYLVTDVVHRYEDEAQNKFYNPSLVVTYLPFGSSTVDASPPPERDSEETGR